MQMQHEFRDAHENEGKYDSDNDKADFDANDTVHNTDNGNGNEKANMMIKMHHCEHS